MPQFCSAKYCLILLGLLVSAHIHIMWHHLLFRAYLSQFDSIYPPTGNKQSPFTFLLHLSFADICQCFLFHGRHCYPSGKTSVPILFPRFFSCHYPSGFSVQPAGESEQRHFRRHINYRIGHQPFAVHLQTSSPYCEASFTVHRKEHIAYSSFLPRLYRTVQIFFLPFFSFDPTGICFLCTATVITLYGSIFIAFCLDKPYLSPFFFGKKILI